MTEPVNAVCDTCGNDYDRTFTVEMDGRRHVFDCFECAIHRLAPECASCSCRVIGHGVQIDDTVYCCASCARRSTDAATVRDRVDGRSMG
jgi:hypothetical protein